jgi:hypothetical protein
LVKFNNLDVQLKNFCINSYLVNYGVIDEYNSYRVCTYSILERFSRLLTFLIIDAYLYRQNYVGAAVAVHVCLLDSTAT